MGVGQGMRGVRVGRTHGVRVGNGYGSALVGVRVGRTVGRGSRVRQGLGRGLSLLSAVAEGSIVGSLSSGLGVGSTVTGTTLGVLVRRAGLISRVKEGVGKGSDCSVALGAGVGTAVASLGTVVGLG